MRMIGILLLAGAGLLCAGDVTDPITGLGGKVERDSAGNVVAVNLRGTWVDDAEMIDIGRLPKLQRLDLSHTRISDEGMLHLKPATSIQDLNLFYSEWITDQGMTAIKNWKNLKRLDLRGTRIANGTLEVVSHMPQLEALFIANTQITDNGMDQLVRMTGLKELSIGQGRLGENALDFLHMLPGLTQLSIGGAKPTPPDMGGGRRGVGPTPPLPDSAVQAMAQLKNLRVLRLAYTGVAANDLKAWSVLGNIEKLALDECPRIDDSALVELAGWKNLKYLDIQDTKVTTQGVEALRKAKPGLMILTNLGEKPKG